MSFHLLTEESTTRCSESTIDHGTFCFDCIYTKKTSILCLQRYYGTLPLSLRETSVLDCVSVCIDYIVYVVVSLYCVIRWICVATIVYIHCIYSIWFSIGVAYYVAVALRMTSVCSIYKHG